MTAYQLRHLVSSYKFISFGLKQFSTFFFDIPISRILGFDILLNNSSSIHNTGWRLLLYDERCTVYTETFPSSPGARGGDKPTFFGRKKYQKGNCKRKRKKENRNGGN
jgi:hypothetical protein